MPCWVLTTACYW